MEIQRHSPSTLYVICYYCLGHSILTDSDVYSSSWYF